MSISQIQGITASRAVSITGGTADGVTITNSPIAGSSGSFTTVSADSGGINGDLTVSGKVTVGQAVSAASLHINGIVSAASINITGDLKAATGLVTASAATITALLTGSTATFSGIVSALAVQVNASGGLEFATVVSGQGAQAATLLNSPIAGNPSFYIPVRINGTIRFIPAW